MLEMEDGWSCEYAGQPGSWQTDIAKRLWRQLGPIRTFTLKFRPLTITFTSERLADHSARRVATSHHGRMYKNSHVRQRKPVAQFAHLIRSPAIITKTPTASSACIKVR